MKLGGRKEAQEEEDRQDFAVLYHAHTHVCTRGSLAGMVGTWLTPTSEHRAASEYGSDQAGKDPECVGWPRVEGG